MARKVLTKQPLGVAKVAWGNPITRDLVFAATGDMTTNLAALDPRIAITGTKNSSVGRYRGRGFGATSGVGTSDIVSSQTYFGGTPGQTFFVFHAPNGLGENNLGRICTGENAGNSGMFYNYGTLGNFYIWPTGSTTPGYTTGLSLAAGTPVIYSASTDTSWTYHNFYVNGAKVPAAQITYGSGAPSGAGGNLAVSSNPISIGQRSTGGRGYDGTIFCAFVWNRALSDAEHLSLAQNPWQLFAANDTVALFTVPQAGGGSTAYTLTASTGSFSLSGQAATFTQGHTLTAAKGTFTLTGQGVTFTQGHTLSAGKGTFSLTGNDATLTFTHPGSSTLIAGVGAFSLTGNAANLGWSRTLTAAKGAFSLTGQDATLVKGYVLSAGTGAFALTGNDAVLSTTGTVTVTRKDEPAGRPSKGRKRRRVVIGDRTYDVLERDIPALLEAELLNKRPPSTAEVVEGPKPLPKRKPKTDSVETVELTEAPSLDEVEQRYMALQQQLSMQAQADLQRMFSQVAQRVIADMEDEEETLIALLLA